MAVWPAELEENLGATGVPALQNPQPNHRQVASLCPDVFDRGHFAVYSMGDCALEREIIGLFISQIEDVERQLASIDRAEDWKFLTHTLKGTAAALGAWTIHRLAISWETAGLPQNPASRAQMRQDFAAAAQSFRQAAHS